MNEQAINQVISNYAIENANLRIQVATLQEELNKLENERNNDLEKVKEEGK